MLLIQAVDAYLACLVERGCSRSHRDSVGLRLGRLLTGRETWELLAVNGVVLEAHFDELRERGLAMGTLAGQRATLKAFLNWCAGEGWVEGNPAGLLSGRRFRFSFAPINHQPADRDDLQRVVEALPVFARANGFAPRDVRDALTVSLAVDSSSRRGEIWNLRRADMERALERGQPAGAGRLVYRALVSGKTGATMIRFFDESAGLARRWLELMPEEATWLFCSLRTGQRLKRSNMNLAFGRVCRFAGVPTFRFQAVRKRVVMDAIAHSGDAKVGQLLAGHTDARTTATYYNLVQEEQVAAAAAALATERRGRPEADGDALAMMLFS